MIETTLLSSSSSTRPAAAPAPDEALVAAWVSRADQPAFARLVERHQAYVFRLALSVLGPGFEADAEDVAQEVFVRVASRLAEFRGECLFRTWLHRLTLNLAVDRRRRPRWRKVHVDPAALDRQMATGEEDDPFGSAAAAERSRAVLSCLDKLPDRLRQVIHMRYWMDLQIENIAEVLQMPLGTVKSHLHRGRQLLFRAMQAKGLAGEVPSSTRPRRAPLTPACAASGPRVAW